MNLAGIRLAVLREITNAGEVGRTGVEVEAALNLNRPTGSSRCSELKRAGYIEASNLRRFTASNRPAVCWVVTQAGREALEVATKLEGK